MVSGRWPDEVISGSGLNAPCYPASLNWQVASDLASWIRRLIAEKSLDLVGEPNFGSRLFVPPRPTFLN